MRHAARLGIASLGTIGFCLAAVASFAPGAAAQGREPLCRRAAPLPPLPPESRLDQQQQRYRGHPAPPVLVEPAKGYGPVMAAPPAPPPPPPEPTPPPPMDVAEESGADSISVAGSRASSSARESTTPLSTADDYVDEARPAPGYHRPPRPRPPSGLLTAGDHDDLLNPELYSS